ncbi:MULTISPECIES: DegV family protein [unclassified Clostridioides]|uniref:DegV family protein n=1 Tax=unclassified Clostridioides TaxID=2635829 RepID=UPI001D0CB136|nr:DegV family protein [Clostridioides sp. ES-S-0049-03]MCC0653053.1 DegV family protein [Clostridioides sp. ES-S-0001-03]MCC0656963.1 DegV family protein [Clostridioides sp. ES-S-0123-01]MCC0672373.1 DegV family protein [Clostridioides sp. ES-S-0145-01]MCC0675702.1 DegV family protein [Clostridioides sp. ES-W-0018-02]MCC0680321.1 DegV family protein [Clostridioides sp. ES-S-0005-03]MCC0695466.1 DegV family protein [Clostridioides sp. ES-S-0048-02]MCC0701632.1 DegV family protein [Clostridio
MDKIKLIVDSACDLPNHIIEKYNIEVIGLNVSFGEENYISGKEIDNETFYRKMDESKLLPKTSCPSPDKFLEAYQCEEESILVISISSGLSGTYNSALLAKDMFEKEGNNKKIEIIDSLSGSIGIGQLVLKAAILIKEGKELEEIVSIIDRYKDNPPFYGTLETLENAIKGGRINPIAGKIINTLNFKAIIQVADGIVTPIDKARGEGNSLKKLIQLVESKIIDKEEKVLFIGHANCPEKAQKVREAMEKDVKYKDVVICEVGSVMGTYTSKGAILITAI